MINVAVIFIFIFIFMCKKDSNVIGGFYWATIVNNFFE